MAELSVVIIASDDEQRAVLQVLDVREKKIDRKNINIKDLVARYLAAVEKVTTAVDLALDSDAAAPA